LQEEAQEDSESDDDEQQIYNPLKLPMGWDGKPIPYWLYKLHGLGQVLFTCHSFAGYIPSRCYCCLFVSFEVTQLVQALQSLSLSRGVEKSKRKLLKEIVVVYIPLPVGSIALDNSIDLERKLETCYL
jgi:hypothetical protein